MKKKLDSINKAINNLHSRLSAIQKQDGDEDDLLQDVICHLEDAMSALDEMEVSETVRRKQDIGEINI